VSIEHQLSEIAESSGARRAEEIGPFEIMTLRLEGDGSIIFTRADGTKFVAPKSSDLSGETDLICGEVLREAFEALFAITFRPGQLYIRHRRENKTLTFIEAGR
jgi:hypothetical protein